MITQGNGAFNPNNHPFPGVCEQTHFALAHNGVLSNDEALKRRFHLPKSNIQTDSYVAVQLLEQEGALNTQTIGKTAALLEGSFSLSILDEFNQLYLVKGNSPLCIYRFENGLTCYASTAGILKEALARCAFLPANKEIISMLEGDILCIRPDGRLQMSRFDTSKLYKRLRWWDCGDYDDWSIKKYSGLYQEEEPASLDTLLETACNMGFLEEDIYLLLEEGFDESEIEALLNSPAAFYDSLADAAYARIDG